MLELETELNQLKSKNLGHLIPNYLYNYFKISYNEIILNDLFNSLNRIIATKNNNDNLNNTVDISLSVFDAFNNYHKHIKSLLSLLDKQKVYLTGKAFNGGILSLDNDILLYQRSILTQSFSIEHYDLLNLLFRKVFDIYHAANNDDNLNEGNLIIVNS